jgi:TRAP-type C4-dicarboxylate transport system permease small subunit
MGYFRILAAIPGFFLSAFFLMVLWGVIASKLGAVTISYPMAMLVTITIWLVVAPLAAVGKPNRH